MEGPGRGGNYRYQNPTINPILDCESKMTNAAEKREASKNSNMESLDQQVNSMMLISENVDPYQQGRARICKVCGKEGCMQNIMSHIEANHIAGISIPCPRCGQYFKTKNGLQTHKSRHHRNQ